MPTQILSQRTSLKVDINLLQHLLHRMLRHLSCYVRLVHLARVPYLEALRFLAGNASAQSCNDFEQYCRELGHRGKLTVVIFHGCALEASRLHMVFSALLRKVAQMRKTGAKQCRNQQKLSLHVSSHMFNWIVLAINSKPVSAILFVGASVICTASFSKLMFECVRGIEPKYFGNMF